MLINVPQGKSGRLKKDVPEVLNIRGLYTSRFSACVIIAYIGKEHLALMHHDNISTCEHIKNEINDLEKLEGNFEIILITRNDNSSLIKVISTYFKSKLAQYKPTVKKMDSKHDGIQLSFETNPANTIHPQIIKHPIGIDPSNLLRHPQEQKLLTTQKIRQIIGLRDIKESMTTSYVPYCMFNGFFWTAFDDQELTVDISTKWAKLEMGSFNKGDSFTTIAGKLGGIIKSIQQTHKIELQTNIKTLMSAVAEHVESYITDYDYVFPFKRNMLEAINYDSPQSLIDHQYKKKIISALKSPGDHFKLVTTLTKEYESQHDSTEFKKNIINEYEFFSKHYRNRKLYTDLAAKRKKLQEKIIPLNKKATAQYREKKYNDASKTFLAVFKTCSQIYTINNPALSTVCFNIGRCFQNLADHQSAHFFLLASFNQRKKYDENQERITKTKAALEKSEKQLEMSGSSKHRIST